MYAQNSSNAKRVVVPNPNIGLRFTENNGQWNNNILLRAQLDGGAVYLEKHTLTFDFYDKKKYRSRHMGEGGLDTLNYLKAHCFKIEFLNAQNSSTIQKEKPNPDYENFYLGTDSKTWKTNVKNYNKATYKNLYNGIDYEVYAKSKHLKNTFYVAPNANYKQIQMQYTGAEKIKLSKERLIIITSLDSIVEEKPFAYQLVNNSKVEVPCRYVLKNNILSYEFPKGYDVTKELIIDPILVFAAQSGSTADNFGMTATYDAQGNLYSGGTAFNNGYPVTTGAYQLSFAGTYTPNTGNTDVVVTKYNSTGTGLLFSTYLGGTRSEIVTSLIVDQNNNLYLYGATGSSNFPTTAGAFDNTFNGGNYMYFMFNGTEFLNGTDIFVSKFNSTGTSLLASTYIGGSDNDGVNHTNALVSYVVTVNSNCTSPGNTTCYPCGGTFSINEYKADSLQHNYGDQYRGEIQLDKFGNVYIASSTRSNNFPTLGGFKSTFSTPADKQDAVVFKMNPGLSSLAWSTYLGGSGNDAGYSLFVSDSLYTYVTGGTYSTDFPTKPGCYNTSYNGGKGDGYIVKINPAGNAILKGTYIGTSNYDQSYFVTIDKKNQVYCYGQSLGNMPVSSGVYSNPGTHQFIARLDAQLSNINLSTVFGASTTNIDISPSAFAVDKCENIYASGWGGDIIYGPSTSGMPTTTTAIFPTSPNGFDFYLAALSPSMASLLYGTYFGGACSKEHVDGGTSRFDPSGKIYQSVCAGCGGNQDFPVTAGAWPNTPPFPNHNTDNNNCNNGVFKFDFQLQLVVSTINTNTLAGCAPVVINFTNAAAPTGSLASFIWYLGGGITNTTTINPSMTYTAPGVYTVALVVKDPSTCNVKDSSVTFITVYPKPLASFSLTSSPCTNTFAISNNSTGTFTTNSFSWNFGNSVTSTLSAPSYTYPINGVYNVSLTVTDVNGCKSTAINTISVLNFTPNALGTSYCYGQTGALNAGGGTNYLWTPATALSNNVIANPITTTSINTNYSVQITNTSFGQNCVQTITVQATVYPKPIASFNYSINPCGGAVNFFDTSSPIPASWQWTLNAGATSTLQNPYYFYSSGGTQTITQIVTSNMGCKDTSIQIINVPVPPPVSVSASTNICIGHTYQLSATGGITYSWSPASSIDIPNISTPIASPSVSTSYSVIITTSTACTFTLITNVNVYSASSTTPSASANPLVITTGGSTTLTYIGDPGAIVTWYPFGSTNPTTGYTVSASPGLPTTYTAIANYGVCANRVIVLVDAYTPGCISSDVFVPNTFTPNGDGENDVLYVRGLKINEIYFAVYNRWGELMFETNDKLKGWDGTYNGKPCEVGVFGWYLRVKCVNGLESFKKGNTTLIR
ncbi:MAG: gliding motility-associated C-terminal domain-containing protein [Bacteroidetes bacterium]|nr:gliding motility-associated C-terminal domain-containing protein [Bacteroidota bacterium]